MCGRSSNDDGGRFDIVIACICVHSIALGRHTFSSSVCGAWVYTNMERKLCRPVECVEQHDSFGFVRELL